jgi:hypothetical protein
MHCLHCDLSLGSADDDGDAVGIGRSFTKSPLSHLAVTPRTEAEEFSQAAPSQSCFDFEGFEIHAGNMFGFSGNRQAKISESAEWTVFGFYEQSAT